MLCAQGKRHSEQEVGGELTQKEADEFVASLLNLQGYDLDKSITDDFN